MAVIVEGSRGVGFHWRRGADESPGDGAPGLVVVMVKERRGRRGPRLFLTWARILALGFMGSWVRRRIDRARAV